MLDCLQFFEQERRENANIASYTQAVGWSGLFNGFATEKGNQSTPLDFLPFKDKSDSADKTLISDRTKKILKQLFDSKKLNPVLMSALCVYLE
ncbi:MAG: hypothetical protein F6K65_06455 [Moorea sp. SIO3C2]|nr:hypothetical protein [Moorena sp. SIO3C2]